MGRLLKEKDFLLKQRDRRIPCAPGKWLTLSVGLNKRSSSKTKIFGHSLDLPVGWSV
jgi:hypothetical protein